MANAKARQTPVAERTVFDNGKMRISVDRYCYTVLVGRKYSYYPSLTELFRGVMKQKTRDLFTSGEFKDFFQLEEVNRKALEELRVLTSAIDFKLCREYK